MLNNPDERKLQAELDVQQDLFSKIDSRRSFVFESGAGSGKTYALVECIRYILDTKGEALKQRQQQIACITFTNVAANEIKGRLGERGAVSISTIHDFLWPRIRPHKQELLEIHKEKLLEEIEVNRAQLLSNSKYAKYQELGTSEQTVFQERALAAKEELLPIYSLKADEARELANEKLGDLPFLKGLHGNIANFKSLLSATFRIAAYTHRLESLNSGSAEVQEVIYDPTRNTDKLDRMKISHDTLLEYGQRLTERYPDLCISLISQHPYWLIDEYQDTSPLVVRLINSLISIAETKERELFVGFFGDSAQSIYENGVGSLENHCPTLSRVYKTFNRRSCSEIIRLANKIRMDRANQESIFLDADGGLVELFTVSDPSSFCPKLIGEFAQSTAEDFSATASGPLHCLVLTNETIASLSGFGNLYEAVKKTGYFSHHFDRLSTEFMPSNPSKLNFSTRLLFDLCHLRESLLSDSTLLKDLNIDKAIRKEEIGFDDLRQSILKLRSAGGANPKEYLLELENIIQRESKGIKRCINALACCALELDSETISYARIVEQLATTLQQQTLTADETSVGQIETILQTDWAEYRNWHSYVLDQQSGPIRYHTYHGSKGAEYDSVLLIASNHFGRRKSHFDDIIRLAAKTERPNMLPDDLKNARNLFYVAITRAIKRLRILYTDDITDFKEEVETLFGPIQYI